MLMSLDLYDSKRKELRRSEQERNASILSSYPDSSLSGWLVILIFIFNADQQITFPLSFLYCYISGKIEAPSSGSPPSSSSPPSSISPPSSSSPPSTSSLEWYYIGGPLAAIVFLLALISYIKKRRETGKMLLYENKMSSYGRLWLLIRQCFGARRSYFKQVIFCISSTDFEGPSTVPAKPITNQITKTLQII